MFDMLEKKRGTLHLYLLMTMICYVALTVSSTDTNDNNSMCIGKKGENVTNTSSSFRLMLYPNFCAIVGGCWPSRSSRRTRKCFVAQNVGNCA